MAPLPPSSVTRPSAFADGRAPSPAPRYSPLGKTPELAPSAEKKNRALGRNHRADGRLGLDRHPAHVIAFDSVDRIGTIVPKMRVRVVRWGEPSQHRYWRDRQLRRAHLFIYGCNDYNDRLEPGTPLPCPAVIGERRALLFFGSHAPTG